MSSASRSPKQITVACHGHMSIAPTVQSKQHQSTPALLRPARHAIPNMESDATTTPRGAPYATFSSGVRNRTARRSRAMPNTAMAPRSNTETTRLEKRIAVRSYLNLPVYQAWHRSELTNHSMSGRFRYLPQSHRLLYAGAVCRALRSKKRTNYRTISCRNPHGAA